MEFYIDTADLEEIKEAADYLPIAGVTSNPSIIKKVSPENFFDHMRKVRNIIGKERGLHIQAVSKTAQGMIEEAKRIADEIDEEVYIKIPVTLEGLKAIRELKAKGYRVTATAVYDLMQAYLALEAGADFIAPYVNRISNLGADPNDLIEHLSRKIREDGYDCKILAASFKGLRQVRDSLDHGAQSVTVLPELLKQVFKNPNIDKAVGDFNADWYSIYGQDCSICDL